MANSPLDPTLGLIRRKLNGSTVPETLSPDPRTNGNGFDHTSENGMTVPGLDQLLKPRPSGPDDVDALLERYQAEKGLPISEVPVPPAARRGSGSGLRLTGGSSHLEGPRPGAGRGLPPLTRNGEFERLQEENAELRQLVNEYRELLEANDPAIWEQKVVEAERLMAEKDEQLLEMGLRVEEWDEKFKTHRFVPNEDDLAKEADEFDKERARLAQERKQLEADRQQLKDDEVAMTNQMREMEVGMAKDRADLARQRTELQRLHNDIKHEMELMQRGDASVKDRLAQFQRRYQETVTRPSSPPPAAPMPPPSPALTPPPAAASTPTPRARDSSMFKKLFGKSE